MVMGALQSGLPKPYGLPRGPFEHRPKAHYAHPQDLALTVVLLPFVQASFCTLKQSPHSCLHVTANIESDALSIERSLFCYWAERLLRGAVWVSLRTPTCKLWCLDFVLAGSLHRLLVENLAMVRRRSATGRTPGTEMYRPANASIPNRCDPRKVQPLAMLPKLR